MKRNILLAFFLFLTIGLFAQRAGSGGGSDRISTELVQADLQVFPNPATSFIGVTHKGEVSKIKVFNLVGRQMKVFTAVQGEKHFVGDLPRGMYLVQLIDNKNKIITTKRVNKR